MNTTISNYPGFQKLPDGVRRMLLVSEAYFRDQSASQHRGTISQVKGHPRKRPLTFGDFVAGVYQAWGKRKAKGIVQLAIKAHVIEFRGTERFVVA